MSIAVILTALLGAAFVMLVASRLLHPPRRLGPRLELYTVPSRVRLETMDTASASLAMHSDSINLGSTFQEIFKPLLVMMADGLGTLLDAGETEDLRLRLRRAGVATNPDDYRLRQLTFAFAGLALGFLLGWQYSDGNLWFSLGIMAFMGFAGAVIQRTVLDRTLRNRIELIQGELYTVVHLLAMYVRTGHGPVESVRRVAERSSGIVSDQMTQALSWIERGRAADAAFAELAQLTPEPAEARLYRLLSSATVSGTDITDSLIALARDLRNQRRDEVERSAVKRRSTMIIPLLIFSAPVLLALIGGPAVVLILREL